MITVEQAFFKTLEAALEPLGLRPLVSQEKAGVGFAEITPLDGFERVLTFHFAFSPGYNYFESTAYVWPRLGRNPKIIIARTSDEVGEVLKAIIAYLVRT